MVTKSKTPSKQEARARRMAKSNPLLSFNFAEPTPAPKPPPAAKKSPPVAKPPAKPPPAKEQPSSQPSPSTQPSSQPSQPSQTSHLQLQLPPIFRSHSSGPPPLRSPPSPSRSLSSSLPPPPNYPPPPPPSNPPLPVRNPLRSSSSGTSTMPDPPPRPRRPATPPVLDIGDFAFIADDPLPLPPLTIPTSPQSYPTAIQDSPTESKRSLSFRPESSLLSIEDENSSSGSSSMSQSPLTKRQHALHELLSSERAYASDLALIREFHIPLALGHPVPLNVPISSAPLLLSSSSSSPTMSTASDSSTKELGPPMTHEDTRIIFSNIAELAQFSDRFSECLEDAMGSLLEGGVGEDRIGSLFLEIIPVMEKPYKYYITRHPSALRHLQLLPQTPALIEYMQRTQSVASNLSHAWDIASLLIKPVQRLLKYSLLLGAIIDVTPDTHSDKQNLKLARTRMEEVARNVNEGQRRAEVVKEVLTSKKRPAVNVGVGVAASVNLTKMKSLSRSGIGIAKPADGEAAQVERYAGELKRIDTFTQQFAKSVVDWAKMMNHVMIALRTWAMGFGKVIGLGLGVSKEQQESKSEAFDAFMGVVEEQLIPLSHRLEAEVNERLLREIAHLLSTMNLPLKLLASMEEQEPFHYHLLTMNVSAKNRPPPSLLAASTNYLALRGQLAAELPAYIALLHRGLAGFVLRLAQIQGTFWGDVRDRWAELWDMLRVEGEMNAGHEETVAVWQARWMDVDEVVSMLNITQARKIYQEPVPVYDPAGVVSPMLASLEPQLSPKHRHKAAAVNINNALSEKVVSGPQPLGTRSRPRGQSDASTAPAQQKRNSVDKRTSNDQLPMKKRDALMDFVAGLPGPGPRTKSPGREQVPPAHHQQLQHPPLPRAKSMPLSNNTPAHEPHYTLASAYRSADGDTFSQEYQDQSFEEERGRTSRKPSFRRKLTETIRPGHYRQRSHSKSASAVPVPAYDDTDATATTSTSPPPSSPPHSTHTSHTTHTHTTRTRDSNPNRDSWSTKPSKYTCVVVHACRPPVPVSYFSFPFFTLVEGDLYEVLHEAGHPSIHSKLPLHVDDGEDCLLLCRDGGGDVGWALASFLKPVEGGFD